MHWEVKRLANLKSAKKRIRVTERKTKVNRRRRNEVKTYTRLFNEAIENANVEEAQELIKVLDKKLKKAVQAGIIHQNKASRELSRQTKKLNAVL